MAINPLTPEERCAVADLDETLSVPATQELCADLVLHLHRRTEQLIATLTPRERDILEKRLKKADGR